MFAGLTKADHQTSQTQGVGDLDYLVRVLCDNFTYERERVGMEQGKALSWLQFSRGGFDLRAFSNNGNIALKIVRSFSRLIQY